ncbi:MAG: hypothetical protein QM796_22700 [Chthoniobacteraceae bacterium]
MKSKEHPFLAGLHAARVNFVPGLIIQCAMLGLLLGYYYWPPLRDLLGTVAGWKQHLGYGFSFFTYAVAGGLLPEVLRVLVLQKGAIHASNLRDARFGFFFWGIMGMSGDTCYRVQGLLFGNEPTLAVVLIKMAADQFIYTPLWGTAAIVVAYDWHHYGFTLRALRNCLTLDFYRVQVLPSLVTGWAVWIPLVAIIYALPPLLQVPFAALATSFWSLLVTFMRRQATAVTPTPVLAEEEG